jgi:hypothetical protein
MKNLVFNSVAGRSILVLLIGLSISHVASLLVYTAERGEALNLLYDRLVAERMALLGSGAHGVDHAPHRRDAANGAS